MIEFLNSLSIKSINDQQGLIERFNSCLVQKKVESKAILLKEGETSNKIFFEKKVA